MSHKTVTISRQALKQGHWQHGSAAAIVGMRSMNWSFVRPLQVDVPFFFSSKTTSSMEINALTGLVNTVRKVTDADGRAYAIGNLSVVVLRRPAGRG